MNIRVFTLFIVGAFVLFAVFGLYVPFMGAMDHGIGCAFAPGGTSLCGAPLAHLQHWQTAFAATLMYLFTLCATALFFITRHNSSGGNNPQYERYRLHRCIPPRPTLFQKLFSTGLMHPKIF